MLFSEVSGAKSFERRNLGKKPEDARNNFIDMHLIQFLEFEFGFDLHLFSKYLATSINSYFYKMTLHSMAYGSNHDPFFLPKKVSFSLNQWELQQPP